MTNLPKNPLHAERMRLINGHTNGHGLAPQQMPYDGPWHPEATAHAIASSFLPGAPTMLMTPTGPQRGLMQDWTVTADKIRVALIEKHGEMVADWPAPLVHNLNALNAVAEFQRKAMALAEAAQGLMQAEMDALPEPPADRAPEGCMDDDYGHDANGSVIE